MILDMTEGKPLKKILIFFLPILLGNLLQQCYNIADSMVVSRFLGVSAFAGVTATGSLNFLVLGFTWGMTAGCAIPVSQEFGAKNYPEMRRCFGNTIWLCATFSVVLAIVTALLTNSILRLIGTPSDIFDYSSQYIRVIFIGIPATVFYNLFAGIMRSVGDGRTPLYMLLFSSILNVGLDLLFVINFGFGIAGAAWATVIAQAISAILCYLVLRKRFEILRFSREEGRLNFAIIKRLVGIGLPMGLQFSITAIGSTILQSSVNSLGSWAVAAIGAGSKVQFVFNTPIESLGTTMATYCGQNVGARRLDRIKKGVLQLTAVMFVYCVIAFIAQKFLGRSMIRLFIGDSIDAELLENTALYLNTVLMFSFLLVIVMIYRNAIQGMGYSNVAMLAGCLEVVGRCVVALIFVKRIGFSGACYANPAAWLCADLLLFPLFFKVLGRLRDRFTADGKPFMY